MEFGRISTCARAGTDIRYGDVRLDLRPAAAPQDNGVYVSVETRRFVLPQSASVHLVRGSGEEKRNSVEFTHCREYSTEPRLGSGEPDVSAPSVGPAELALPPGLTVKAKLATAIDSTHARVGDEIRATLDAGVRHKNDLIFPKGQS